MNIIVVALSLVAICSATRDDDRQRASRADKFRKDCADELGLTSEEFNKYHRSTQQFVDDPKEQNFNKCMFQKFGFIDPNGDLQESELIKHLVRGRVDITEEQVKQCTARAGDNKANAFVLKLLVCYNAASTANYDNYARTASAATTDSD